MGGASVPNNKLPVGPVGLRCPWDVQMEGSRAEDRGLGCLNQHLQRPLMILHPGTLPLLALPLSQPSLPGP